MKYFIKLPADRQVIVLKPGISSVIGIFTWGSVCISKAQRGPEVLPEGFLPVGAQSWLRTLSLYILSTQTFPFSPIVFISSLALLEFKLWNTNGQV